MRRVARFFFMQIGSFVPVFAYFYLCGTAFTADGVRHALLVALVVDSAYIALAWSQGEVKQFDAGIWTLLATGTLATRAGVETVLRLYQRYSPTLLFVALGLTALIPLVLGRETFTYYYARRRCRSFEGVAPAADLTVYTPDTVWMQIARGELDGERALREGLYRAEGDFGLLSKIPEWFPARR